MVGKIAESRTTRSRSNWNRPPIAASRSAASLEAWLKQELPGQVYWIEGSGDRGDSLQLASAPIEVGPILREKIFDRIPSAILTSATLSVGGSAPFDFFKERLGFPADQPAIQLGSPFDYRQQAELHLFRPMPDPTADAPRASRRRAWRKIQEYVGEPMAGPSCCSRATRRCSGRPTSCAIGCGASGLTLISQGDGTPAKRMLEQFRARPATRCCSASIASGRGWMCKGRRCRTSSSRSCRSRRRTGR